MGFYPKHLHRRRERHMLRVIATAALLGGKFRRLLSSGSPAGLRTTLYWYGWQYHMYDDNWSILFRSRFLAARGFLKGEGVYRGGN